MNFNTFSSSNWDVLVKLDTDSLIKLCEGNAFNINIKALCARSFPTINTLYGMHFNAYALTYGHKI